MAGEPTTASLVPHFCLGLCLEGVAGWGPDPSNSLQGLTTPWQRYTFLPAASHLMRLSGDFLTRLGRAPALPQGVENFYSISLQIQSEADTAEKAAGAFDDMAEPHPLPPPYPHPCITSTALTAQLPAAGLGQCLHQREG